MTLTDTPLCAGFMRLSRLGLGTWAFGGGTDWGPAQDGDSLSAVSAALDGGINWFDSAPVYGDGHAEEVLGRALQGRRDKAFIATKCGLVRFAKGINHWLKPDSVRQELENSLRRLRTDYIDLYQIHWPDPATPLADTLQELVRLRQEGKIRFIGVCNFPLELLREACSLAPITAVQGPYSLLDTAKARAVLPLCQAKKLFFIAYGALAGGILTGKYKKMPNIRRADARSYFYRFYKGETFTDYSCPVVERVRQVAAQQGVCPSAVALAYVLAQAGVKSVLCGARGAAQMAENLTALQVRLTPQEIAYLEGVCR